jgi:hypothetical protein
MIWHESPPKQQTHPRLWLPQAQQPLPDRLAKLRPLFFLPYSPECVEKGRSPKFGFRILFSSRLSGQILPFQTGPSRSGQHYIIVVHKDSRSGKSAT